MSWDVAVVSVVPSPYQRDLFAALARRPEVRLRVYYMEAAAPDSPWPEKAMQPYETILPGRWFSVGSRRVHMNWRLPDLRPFQAVILNTLMSVTGQWIMRKAVKGKPWFFWGERLGQGGALHRALSAPLHHASGIAGVGALAEQDYRARFPEPRHFNIPYHCELEPFFRPARTPSSPDAPVTFLFCGQMIERKGVDLLVNAFARLQDPRARLLLVGREGELPRWLAGLESSVRDRIEYAGFQAPEALPAFFERADVFVLPSRYDGWGVVVNQALGAGLPILCSEAVGAAYDLIEPGVNGLRLPAADLDSLTDAMRRLLDEPETRAAWGRASRARAEAWTPAAGAAKWVEALGAVLSKPACP
jgi:glycosyltransferase involved in cell wall biosynthesis